MDAWKRTRLVRHIQQAEAERHLAAAALVASGLNVLFMEATHVMRRDATPLLHALLKDGTAFDAAFAVSGCHGKPPIGCELWWNLGLLRGAGTQEQRERAVAFQVNGIKTGLIDFYLRWWNGAHCIFSGFGKYYNRCSPTLATSTTPAAMRDLTRDKHALIQLAPHCNRTELGVLPSSFFEQKFFYGTTSAVPTPPPLVVRSAKAEGRDRLRLDRYDEQDFTELVSSMKADGSWFL